MGFWHNIGAVARRELRIMRNRPIYLLGSVVTVAFCAIFFLTFLKQGLPHDLPIGVVDMDNSSLSRNFARQLDATQLGKVIKYDTFQDAREDMQSGKITAICMIPKGMYADVQASRRPTFTYYLNGLYFVGGALSYKNILTMINLADGAVQREVSMRMQSWAGYVLSMSMSIRLETNIPTMDITLPTSSFRECWH